MRCLVTGASGFLGRALSRQLIAQGHEVRAISRKEDPDLAQSGVNYYVEDISKPSANFLNAFCDVDVVFHVAAKVGMWGKYSDFFKVNVSGTRAVIRACKIHKVQALVYTSSPSVIATGKDLRSVDESYPYPSHYKAPYPATKAIAEREILSSNSDGLFTCALRPHLIFGPGDTNLIPTILHKARIGKLIKVGTGKNLVDLTYIDDCVNAHICAALALLNNEQARGRAYFISQDDPVKLWDWIDAVLQKNNLPLINKKIPFWLAYCLACVAEVFVSVLPGNKEPILTKFLVEEMATDHFFDITSARQLLNYHPTLTTEEALALTFNHKSFESVQAA